MIKVRKCFKESNVLFQSENQQAIDTAITTFEYHRRKLEQYVILHPPFLHTLRSIDVELDAPRIVRIMADSTRTFNIGPMAAVAGALADLAIEAMLKLNAEVAIVENGGEISAFSKQVFNVELYAGRIGLSKSIGFQINPIDCPIGIGTSSATISHAFSFGEADSATVFADTAALADAAATAVCNMVQGDDVEASIRKGLKYAENSHVVRGALIIRRTHVGIVGKLPKFLAIDKQSNSNIITNSFTLIT